MARLTHVDDSGAARMVDVGHKTATRRRARARGTVRLGATAFGLLRSNRLAKGDALAIARIAGIQAAKRTPEWIPLCHGIPLEHVEVAVVLKPRRREVEVTVEAAATWVTGVEMEALTGAAAACLAIYDMVKGVDRGARVESVELLEKSGGRSGRWVRKGVRSKQGAGSS